jgi:RNAse (barnase) inhibitor barstar
LPPDLGFKSIAIRDQAEVVFETHSGDFLIDSLSGGVAALVELAWQIFMFQSTSDFYMVVIDEPENHLHAGMQRTLLPNLLLAFPAAQFVIATHSPLVVGSVRDSHVYALRFGDDHRVFSDRLDLRDKAGTAEDILREVLDVGVTMPVWAEHALERVLHEYVGRTLTIESARALRSELIRAGLDRLVPQALAQIASERGLP